VNAIRAHREGENGDLALHLSQDEEEEADRVVANTTKVRDCLYEVHSKCWPPAYLKQPTCPEEYADWCVHCAECKEAEGRIFIQTPDDGNCMFYAVAAAFRSYQLGVSLSNGLKDTSLKLENNRLYNFGHNAWQYRQEAARILEALLKGTYFAEQDHVPLIEDIRNLIFTEMLSYGDYDFASETWQRDYLKTLRAGAQPGQRGSKYWGGSAALVALATYLNAQILVYDAAGRPPSEYLRRMLTPSGWIGNTGITLTVWLHKDDDTGRGGTHYDAFTAPFGPDSTNGPHW